MRPEQEPQRIPGWARKEQASDMVWAQAGYEAMGRGALLIDTTIVVQEQGRAGTSMFHVPQADRARL